MELRETKKKNTRKIHRAKDSNPLIESINPHDKGKEPPETQLCKVSEPNNKEQELKYFGRYFTMFFFQVFKQ